MDKPQNPSFPVYTETVKRRFLKLFRILEGVLLKGASFSELKICLHVNRNFLYKNVCKEKYPRIFARGLNWQPVAHVWDFFFFTPFLFLVGRAGGRPSSLTSMLQMDPSCPGKPNVPMTNTSSDMSLVSCQVIFHATLMLPLAGFVWRHPSASQHRHVPARQQHTGARDKRQMLCDDGKCHVAHVRAASLAC